MVRLLYNISYRRIHDTSDLLIDDLDDLDDLLLDDLDSLDDLDYLDA